MPPIKGRCTSQVSPLTMMLDCRIRLLKVKFSGYHSHGGVSGHHLCQLQRSRALILSSEQHCSRNLLIDKDNFPDKGYGLYCEVRSNAFMFFLEFFKYRVCI